MISYAGKRLQQANPEMAIEEFHAIPIIVEPAKSIESSSRPALDLAVVEHQGAVAIKISINPKEAANT